MTWLEDKTTYSGYSVSRFTRIEGETTMTTETLKWVVRGSNHDGTVIRFYNGKAGKAWLSESRSEGFRYDSQYAAQQKAKMFNTMEPIHGFWFHATTHE